MARSRTVSRVTPWMPFGDRVVIIGGDLVGLELAEFLAQRGRTVTVVDDAAKFGKGLQIVRRWRVLQELRDLGVALVPKVSGIEIGVNVVRGVPDNGVAEQWPADHVIIAKGAEADQRLAEELADAGFNVTAIGDCDSIGFIEGAIRSAAETASEIACS